MSYTDGCNDHDHLQLFVHKSLTTNSKEKILLRNFLEILKRIFPSIMMNSQTTQYCDDLIERVKTLA